MQLQINYYKAMEMSVTMQRLEGLEETGHLRERRSSGTSQRKEATLTDAWREKVRESPVMQPGG